MEGLRIFLIVLLAVLLLLYFLKQQWSHRHLPPGPLALPLIGGVWRINFGIGYNEETLIKLAKQYGSILTYWAGHIPVIVLSGFEAVKEGLVDHLEEFSDRPETPFLALVGRGKGIILSNGHTWKQQRRFGLVTLRKLGVGKKSMEGQIEEESRQLVEIFACEKGQPFDPALPITNSVSNVICAVTFGYRFPLGDETFKKLIDAVAFTLQFAGSPFHVDYCYGYTAPGLDGNGIIELQLTLYLAWKHNTGNFLTSASKLLQTALSFNNMQKQILA